MKTFLLNDGEFTGLIKSLRTLNEQVRIVGFVSSSGCAHTALLDRYYIAPHYSSSDYYTFLKETCETEKVDYVFPVATGSLSLMARIADRLYEETGAKVITSSPEAIDIANHKGKLFDRLSTGSTKDHITEYTRVLTFRELASAVESFHSRGMECISKPVIGENAEGFLRFTDKETFVKRSLEGTAGKLFCKEWLDVYPPDQKLPEERIVMPYLPGKEWDVDVLCQNGTIISITIRLNHDMFGGLSASSVTCRNDDLLKAAAGIVSELNLSYLHCISFKEDENGIPMLLEINPRAFGSVYLSVLSGNNLIKTLFEEVLVPGYTLPLHPNVTKEGTRASLYYDLIRVDDSNPPSVNWNTISPPHYSVYQKYYDQTDSRIVDIVFNCRFAWDALYHFKWAIIEDCFVQISLESSDTVPYMLMPLGRLDKEKIERIIRKVYPFFREKGLEMTIYGIDRSYADMFDSISIPHDPIYYNDDFSDYLYMADSLRELTGRKYSKKRNHFKNFEKKYPDYQYDSLSERYFAECLDLVRKWEVYKNADLDDPDESDYLMIANTLKNWYRLNARGGVILINGHVEAFSIGSYEKDTAFIHFEKASADIDGIYTAINKLTLVHEFPDAVYVNREEDLGIPGLRQAKQSYHPTELIRKYKMHIL